MKIKTSKTSELLIHDLALAAIDINIKAMTIEISLTSGDVIENKYETQIEFEEARTHIHKQMNILNSNILPNVLTELKNISNNLAKLR